MQFMGVCAINGRTMLVTEYCEGGDLWNALAAPDSAFAWNRRQALPFSAPLAAAPCNTAACCVGQPASMRMPGC